MKKRKQKELDVDEDALGETQESKDDSEGE